MPAHGETPAVAPPNGAPCPSCGGAAASGAVAPSFVYAIGHVKATFPSLTVEKEFAQATGRTKTAGKTDEETLYEVLSQPENRYLARQMCWVFVIQDLETYILHPRDPKDLDRLIEAVRPQPSPMDLDVVIGTRGPIVPPEYCNGLMVPLVVFEQMYSFDRESLLKAIPRPKEIDEKKFEATARNILNRVLQMTDNAGATDGDRAVNYLAVRYKDIFERAAERFDQDFSLTGLETRPAALSGTRNLVDVIFTYTNRNSDFVEKYSVRVDMTGLFPFLVTKLTPYYDR
jgi:hypothetical protein